jgi:hypothetical protein
VKNFARLLLVFSITFFVIFLTVTGIRFLSLRVDWAKHLPPRPESVLTLIVSAAYWALSFSLFSTILFSLSYAGRKGFSSLMAIITITGFSLFYGLSFSFLLDGWSSVPPSTSTGIPLGDKGLILSNSLNRNETAVILLMGTTEPLGPRVVAIPDQPLIFQEAASANFELPPVLFGDDTPFFLNSLFIDIRLNAENMQRRFTEGVFSFIFYTGSLIFLLCSLGYAIKFSVWPLVNLFLGILSFRGILAFETFFNTPEMQEITGSFLNGIIPVSAALPLLFLGLGILLHLFSFLVKFSKRQVDDDN